MSLEDLTPQQRANLRAGELLFSNPELAGHAKRLLKKADPKLQFPDVDLEDALEAERTARKKETDDLRNTIHENQIKETRRAKHAELKEQGYDPVAVEKIMTDNKIMDYAAACRYMDAVNTPAAPTPQSITPTSLPDTKELWTNPIKWGRNAAFDALTEIQGKRAKA